MSLTPIVPANDLLITEIMAHARDAVLLYATMSNSQLSTETFVRDWVAVKVHQTYPASGSHNRNLSRRLSELAPEHTAAFAAGNQRNFRIDLVIWAGADWAGLILEFKLNTNIAGDVCRTAAFLHWANHTAIDGYLIACCIAPAMSDFDKYEVQLCDQSGLHRDGRVLRLDPVRLYSNPAWADDPALCGIFAVKVKATAVA